MGWGQKRERPWGNNGGDRQVKRPREGDDGAARGGGAPPPLPPSDSEGPPAPSEASVGITEYVSRGAGFSGVIKERFADFIVQEIGLDGAVVRLTDLGGKLEDPVDPENAPLSPAQADAAMRALLEPLAYNGPDQLTPAPADGAALPAPVATTAYALLVGFTHLVAAHQQWRDSRKAAKETGAPAPEGGAPFLPVLLLPAPADKAQRKDIHATVRRGYPALESDGIVAPPAWTAGVSPAPASWIQVRAKGTSGAAGSGGRGGDGGGGGAAASGGGRGGDAGATAWRREWWPRGRPDYLSFVLFKENQDTNSSISNISRVLGIKPSTFTYAGIKDRRACTSQRVTAYRVAPERMAGLNRSLQGVMVGGFGWTPNKLFVGDLAGNRFTIVVRGATGLCVEAGAPPAAHAEAVAEALRAWAATSWAFPNYFGLQRFGNRDVPTHAIGRALLQRRFLDALDLILRPREGERPALTAARAAYIATRDATAALAALPQHLNAERAVLAELAAIASDGGDATSPGSAARAATKIEPRLRSLYLHAYQSYLWNRMASARLAAGAGVVLPGDLVLARGEGAEEDGDGGEGEQDGPASEAAASDRNGGSGRPSLPAVAIATAEDVSAGRYSPRDVVLPLPGFAVTYPRIPGVCDAEAVLAMMVADGFDVAALTAEAAPSASADVSSADAAGTLARLWRPRNQDYRLPGGYRRLLAHAKDVDWQVLRYDDPLAVLSLTDLDALEGRTELPAGSTNEEGRLVALRVSFSLPKSAYATMVLRELMKVRPGSAAPGEAAAAAASSSSSSSSSSAPVADEAPAVSE